MRASSSSARPAQVVLRSLCALGLALSAGCSGGSLGGSEPQLDPALGAVAGELAGEPALTTQQLLARIESSTTNVAFHGTRRVRMDYRVVGDDRDLEYLERVVSDGEGRFGLAIGDVVSPAMTPDDEDLFRILQGNRQGFFYNYRDFRIRNLGLFQQGYRLTQTGLSEVCGRPCVELEVRHRQRRSRWYRVAVDPRTGVVMRAEEYAGPAGRMVASVEFESFAEGPPDDPDAVVWYSSPIDRNEIDIDSVSVSTLGFEILRPTLIPEGYRFERADSMKGEDGRNWVRLVYGDGVEYVFFLHSPLRMTSLERIDASEAQDGFGFTHATGLVGTQADPRDDRITVANVGPWAVIEGAVRGQSIVAMGKVVEDELLQMAQSALESKSGAQPPTPSGH